MSFITGTIEELCERLKAVTIAKQNAIPIIQNNEASTSRPMNEKTKIANEKIKIANQKKEKLKEFQKCIEIHLKVKKLVADVCDIFGNVIWMQGFLSIVVLCLIIFAFTFVRQFINSTIKDSEIFLIN
jgi:7tm Odorant receptor